MYVVDIIIFIFIFLSYLKFLSLNSLESEPFFFLPHLVLYTTFNLQVVTKPAKIK